VDDTRNVTQDRKQDVDEEIGIATSLKEDTERREDDGKNDLADVGCGERHVDGVVVVRDYKLTREETDSIARVSLE
jgi:hypothetical protein